MAWPTGTGADYLEFGTVAKDKTLVGSITGGGIKAFLATAIIGTNKTTGQLSLVVLGDSWSSSGADGVFTFPVVNLARTGESVLSADVPAIRRRLPFGSLATHVEHAYGINDFQNVTTTFDLPAHKARHIAWWRMVVSCGLVH